MVFSLARVQLWWVWSYRVSNRATEISWLGTAKRTLSMINSLLAFLAMPFLSAPEGRRSSPSCCLHTQHTFIMFKASKQGVQLSVCLTSWHSCWEELFFLTVLESKGGLLGFFFPRVIRLAKCHLASRGLIWDLDSNSHTVGEFQ